MPSANSTGQSHTGARRTAKEAVERVRLIVREEVLEETSEHDRHVRHHRAHETILKLARLIGRQMAREEMKVLDLAVRMSGSGVVLRPEPFLDGDGFMHGAARLGESVMRVSILAPEPPQRGRGKDRKLKPDPTHWQVFTDGALIARVEQPEDVGPALVPILKG